MNKIMFREQNNKLSLIFTKKNWKQLEIITLVNLYYSIFFFPVVLEMGNEIRQNIEVADIKGGKVKWQWSRKSHDAPGKWTNIPMVTNIGTYLEWTRDG